VSSNGSSSADGRQPLPAVERTTNSTDTDLIAPAHNVGGGQSDAFGEGDQRGARPLGKLVTQGHEKAEGKKASDKPEPPGQLEKIAKIDRSEADGKVERPQRVDKADRLDKMEKVERPAKLDRTERSEKIELPERIEKVERIENVERPTKPEKLGRIERPSKPGNPARVGR
jgi:hypothetical protein